MRDKGFQRAKGSWWKELDIAGGDGDTAIDQPTHDPPCVVIVQLLNDYSDRLRTCVSVAVHKVSSIVPKSGDGSLADITRIAERRDTAAVGLSSSWKGLTQELRILLS